MKKDGSVTSWGRSGASLPPAGLVSVKSVALGGTRGAALLDDCTVIGWGSPEGVPVGLDGVAGLSVGGGQWKSFVAWRQVGLTLPTRVSVEDANSGVVIIPSPAGVGGADIALTTSHPTNSAPATVTMRKGAKVVEFEALAGTVAAARNAQIEVSGDGVKSKSFNVKVTP